MVHNILQAVFNFEFSAAGLILLCISDRPDAQNQPKNVLAAR